MARVLIVDDDRGMCNMLSDLVTSMSHDAVCVHSLGEALSTAESEAFDVVFLDVMMPDGNGLDILPQIRNTKSSPEVIIITGAGTADGAEVAVKNGAWDYLQKPLYPKKIMLPLSRVFQYRESAAKKEQPAVALKLDGIIGSSPQINICLDAVARAANSDANVLITGETGTGKEIFARATHFNSLRSRGPFIVVDCAALPETLVESSLFGYEKGAFTGADKSQNGLFSLADGGTLFLDETGELSLAMQKKFLRVLQERRFRAIGGQREISSNFRLIAATNKSLTEMVAAGQFRDDLLYRLQSIAIELPPLRNRLTDIRELVLFYIEKICSRNKSKAKGFSPEFIDALMLYSWPGNVRELGNVLEGAVSEAGTEPVLFPKHLPVHIRVLAARDSVDTSLEISQKDKEALSVESAPTLLQYKEFREEILAGPEKKYLQDLMVRTRGNIKQACILSGLSRSWLYSLMKKYGISRLGWPDSDTPAA